MEIFLIVLYLFSVYALYKSVESDDTDYDGEDRDEFNLIDSV